MDIVTFFSEIGLDEKEARVMMSVLKIGAQPASVIARHARLDRTTVYRILKNLSSKKLVSESRRKGASVFFLEKIGAIRQFIDGQKEHFDGLSRAFDEISPQLASLGSNIQELPRIQIYDGREKLENFYRDIVRRAVEQELLIIRILGSNTFSQKLEQKELGDIVRNFDHDLRGRGIKADVLIAQGNLTREWVTRLPSFQAMANLPAAGGATNVILVGESVFMVSFRDFPVGIRIDHADIAQTMHFLFDMTKVTKP